MKMPTDEEIEALPQADGFATYICDHCPYVHVVLLDKDNKPLLQVVMGGDTLNALNRTVRKALATTGERNVKRQLS